jgi:hypothetical protein
VRVTISTCRAATYAAPQAQQIKVACHMAGACTLSGLVHCGGGFVHRNPRSSPMRVHYLALDYIICSMHINCAWQSHKLSYAVSRCSGVFFILSMSRGLPQLTWRPHSRHYWRSLIVALFASAVYVAGSCGQESIVQLAPVLRPISPVSARTLIGLLQPHPNTAL